MASKKSIINHKIFKIGVIILLIATIIYNVGSVVFLHQDKFFSHNYWQRYPQLKQTYFNSKYAKKNGTPVPVDEMVYAFAGGYLITGNSPLRVIPEVPPLGKYLIGLSILSFDNENIVELLCGIGSLIFLFLLGKQIFSSNLLALLPVAFYSTEPLFKNQFVYTPLLDLIQLFFLLSSIYFFNFGMTSRNKILYFFIFSILLFGCFISTKFYASGATILAAFFTVLFLHRDKNRLIKLTLVTPLGILVLFLSYFNLFLNHYSFRQVFSDIKWDFIYNSGHIGMPFSVWPLLLINKWYVWYGNNPIISDAQWNIFWPLITIISFIALILYIMNKFKKQKSVEVIMAWIVFYLLFLSIGQTTVRYFVILLPLLYLIALYGIVEFIKKKL